METQNEKLIQQQKNRLQSEITVQMYEEGFINKEAVVQILKGLGFLDDQIATLIVRQVES